MQSIKILAATLLAMLISYPFGQMSAQSCAAPKPVDQASLVGQWKGHFTHNGDLRAFQIQIRQEGDRLVAVSKLDQLDIEKSAFTTWMCASNEIHMRLDLLDQRVIKLIGTPNGSQLNGRMVYYPSPNAEIVRELFAVKKEGL